MGFPKIAAFGYDIAAITAIRWIPPTIASQQTDIADAFQKKNWDIWYFGRVEIGK